jgi:hypothetical protein
MLALSKRRIVNLLAMEKEGENEPFVRQNGVVPVLSATRVRVASDTRRPPENK